MNQFGCLLRACPNETYEIFFINCRKVRYCLNIHPSDSLYSYYISCIQKQRTLAFTCISRANKPFLNLFSNFLLLFSRVFFEKIFPIFSRKHSFPVFYCVIIIIYSAIILLYDIVIQVSVRFLKRCKLNFVGTRNIALKLTEMCK